jgi:hypothetical protein
MTGMTFWRALEQASYLAFVVDKAFLVCSLLAHMIGHPIYVTKYPVHNFTLIGSKMAASGSKRPQKSASACTLMERASQIGLHDDPLFSSAKQIPPNLFHCLGVRNLWIRRKPCTVVYHVGNIRSRGFLQKINPTFHHVHCLPYLMVR